MMDQCVSCGRQFSTGEKFCGNCGAALPTSPVQANQQCQVCREPLDPEYRFCGECGSTVIRPPPVPAAKKIPRQRYADAPRGRLAKTTRRPPDAFEPAPKPEFQPTREPDTAPPSRWWPQSTTGRVVFPMITAAAGIIGYLGSDGNIAAAGILTVAALVFLTFWRNVWISWAMPSATLKEKPAEEAGGAESGKRSGKLEMVVGFVILLIVLAIVRGCGKDIIRALF